MFVDVAGDEEFEADAVGTEDADGIEEEGEEEVDDEAELESDDEGDAEDDKGTAIVGEEAAGLGAEVADREMVEGGVEDEGDEEGETESVTVDESETFDPNPHVRSVCEV